jgi:hypothetical protein
LARVWTPLVAVVALALGTVARCKLHQMSARGHVTTVSGRAAPPEFNLKRLTFESLGRGRGMLVYVDVDGHPRRIDVTTLPGSLAQDAHVFCTVKSARASIA